MRHGSPSGTTKTICVGSPSAKHASCRWWSGKGTTRTPLRRFGSCCSSICQTSPIGCSRTSTGSTIAFAASPVTITLTRDADRGGRDDSLGTGDALLHFILLSVGVTPASLGHLDRFGGTPNLRRVADATNAAGDSSTEGGRSCKGLDREIFRGSRVQQRAICTRSVETRL
jgi:hypothetical protein